MLFNSFAFLFAFLPAAIAGYFALNRWRPGLWANAWLVAASLYFYAFWRAEFVALLLASIAVNFMIGRALARRSRAGRPSRALLFAGVAFDLLLLAYFKYADFLVGNVGALLGLPTATLGVVLPIGISFFTFTQIAFLVDAHQGKASEPGAVNYALFVTYFPHLLAGPILHHREMMPQFADPALKRLDWDNLARGLVLLVLGLAKKVLIADPLAPWAAAGFDNAATLGFADAWIAILAYTMQIYFDFSGYTDMALGMALMMNIRLPQNFDSPYRSRDLRDFWRRWHMTLMRFLRDYVYVPLGGNRLGEARTALLLVATFALGGLWHGASWTFVLWGVANGVGLVVVRAWARIGFALPAPLAWALTFLAVNLGWVLFRAPDVASAMAFYRALLGFEGFSPRLSRPEWSWIAQLPATGGDALLVNWMQVSTLATLLVAFALCAWPRNAWTTVHAMSFSWRWSFATAAALCLSVLALANPTEFLYFNF